MRFLFQQGDFGKKPVRQVRLAPRERSILSLLIRCHSNKKIAAILGCQPAVVRNYLQALSSGLDANGRAQLVRWTLLYPQVLAGDPAPVMLHPEGCPCPSSYCRANSVANIPGESPKPARYRTDVQYASSLRFN